MSGELSIPSVAHCNHSQSLASGKNMGRERKWVLFPCVNGAEEGTRPLFKFKVQNHVNCKYPFSPFCLPIGHMKSWWYHSKLRLGGGCYFTLTPWRLHLSHRCHYRCLDHDAHQWQVTGPMADEHLEYLPWDDHFWLSYSYIHWGGGIKGFMETLRAWNNRGLFNWNHRALMLSIKEYSRNEKGSPQAELPQGWLREPWRKWFTKKIHTYTRLKLLSWEHTFNEDTFPCGVDSSGPGC